jgi:hypothetical protein
MTTFFNLRNPRSISRLVLFSFCIRYVFSFRFLDIVLVFCRNSVSMFSFCSVLKIENFVAELVIDDGEFVSVVLCEDGLSNGLI